LQTDRFGSRIRYDVALPESPLESSAQS
jgi:hypothetical protein